MRLPDKVWIAAATLHKRLPYREDLGVHQILRVYKDVFGRWDMSPGVPATILQHAVANRPPSPGTTRMLYATRRGWRRLYKLGDDCADGRTGRYAPVYDHLPDRFKELLDWYESVYLQPRKFGGVRLDPTQLWDLVRRRVAPVLEQRRFGSEADLAGWLRAETAHALRDEGCDPAIVDEFQFEVLRARRFEGLPGVRRGNAFRERRRFILTRPLDGTGLEIRLSERGVEL